MALVALGWGIRQLVAHPSEPTGSVRLPAALLGLPKYTGPGARDLDTRYARQAAAGSNGHLVHVAAAIYGDPSGSGPALLVSGGACATCAHVSASHEAKSLVARGIADARPFPPGPDGGGLVCGSARGTVYACTWADPRASGTVVYGGGVASGLADAAAKTRQIRALVEH